MTKWFEVLVGIVFAYPFLWISRDSRYITQFISQNSPIWTILNYLMIPLFVGVILIFIVSWLYERKNPQLYIKKEEALKKYMVEMCGLIIVSAIFSYISVFISNWSTINVLYFMNKIGFNATNSIFISIFWISIYFIYLSFAVLFTVIYYRRKFNQSQPPINPRF